jgi:putative heme-binding domain-containing protein
MAMLAIASPQLSGDVVRQLTYQSDPVDDIHYLIVLSRLGAASLETQRPSIARALVSLQPKLEARGLHQDSNWEVRVGEMYQHLVKHDPHLPAAIVRHSAFGHPGHVLFAEGLDPPLRSVAAERLLDYRESHPESRLTGEIISLLATSSQPAHRALVRQQFDEPALQGAVILALAETPDPADQRHYVQGLKSPDLAVLRASVAALERLPASRDVEYQFALLQALRSLGAESRASALRRRVERLLRHNLGQDFEYEPGLLAEDSRAAVCNGWTDMLRRRFPDAAAHHFRSEEEEQRRMQALLSAVDWEAGHAPRGHLLFEQQSCRGCHNTQTAVGPDLAGVTKRFSRDDLFTAILFPNRDVSPRYHTTLVETARGKILTGVIIYESVDGLTLRDSTNQTIRVEASEIDVRRELPSSLMPAGLLDHLQPQELADLYAYLQTL